MARIRAIKPEFYSDTTLADLSISARYFYIGLFCQMDRQGVTIEDPKLLKREIFPYDDDLTIKKIQALLDSLVGSGRLLRFKYQEKHYLFCPNFSKHQKFHKDEKNKYDIPADILPTPSLHPSSTLPTTTDTGAKRPVSCITVSGIPESCIPENCNIETPAVPPLRFDFETIYQEYPRKEGKQDGIKHCKAQIKSQEQYDQLLSAVRRYRDKCQKESTEAKFIKHFSSFMAGGKWRDFLDPDVGTSITGGDEPFSIAKILASRGEADESEPVRSADSKASY